MTVLRRAGLDYWDHVQLSRHLDLSELYRSLPDSRFIYLTTKAIRSHTDYEFNDGDCFVFGPETRGLPQSVLADNPEFLLRIPMPNPAVRSLNLATSVAIILYEAARQTGLFIDQLP